MTVDDVYRELLDRIQRRVFAPGTKLPPVRELADQLMSNSSTVDRAIHRLVAQDLVRTVPRRGTFVADREHGFERPETGIEELRKALRRAWRTGMSVSHIREAVDVELASLGHGPRIAFVECNKRDLDRMQALVTNASGVKVEPILLDETSGRTLDEEFDLVAAPIFHLSDLEPVIRDFDHVIDINFVASAAALRRLATVGRASRVVVCAPTGRGVRRMTSIVGQYFDGRIEPFQAGADDPAVLDGADLVVTNHAADLPAEARGREVLTIEWELEAGFASGFRRRVERALAQRSLPPA
ncbi:GntR family transcriptional regulator [Spirillospora sp. NBC_00431]